MNLTKTVKELLQGDKGLLAMDESIPTCNRRFAALGIPLTEEARRSYRELIVTTPGLAEAISGAILFDETVYQSTKDGRKFVDILQEVGIVPGIKVDAGAVALAAHPGEEITEGLDGLRARLAEYARLGMRFAKWRAVIKIGDGIPSRACIEANALTLARYSGLCQEAGIVPIAEPEVLIDGAHTIERCFEVTQEVLQTLFDQFHTQRIELEGMILKSSMVLSGAQSREQAGVDKVAEETVKCLLRTVPAAVPAVVFLSGGQSPELASAHLSAMNRTYGASAPWVLTYSYSRAIQQPALEIWHGQDANIGRAQEMLYRRAKLNAAARRGEYTASMEL